MTLDTFLAIVNFTYSTISFLSLLFHSTIYTHWLSLILRLHIINLIIGQESQKQLRNSNLFTTAFKLPETVLTFMNPQKEAGYESKNFFSLDYPSLGQSSTYSYVSIIGYLLFYATTNLIRIKTTSKHAIPNELDVQSHETRWHRFKLFISSDKRHFRREFWRLLFVIQGISIFNFLDNFYKLDRSIRIGPFYPLEMTGLVLSVMYFSFYFSFALLIVFAVDREYQKPPDYVYNEENPGYKICSRKEVELYVLDKIRKRQDEVWPRNHFIKQLEPIKEEEEFLEEDEFSSEMEFSNFGEFGSEFERDSNFGFEKEKKVFQNKKAPNGQPGRFLSPFIPPKTLFDSQILKKQQIQNIGILDFSKIKVSHQLGDPQNNSGRTQSTSNHLQIPENSLIGSENSYSQNSEILFYLPDKIHIDERLEKRINRWIQYFEAHVFCILSILKNKDEKFSKNAKFLSLMYVYQDFIALPFIIFSPRISSIACCFIFMAQELIIFIANYLEVCSTSNSKIVKFSRPLFSLGINATVILINFGFIDPKGETVTQIIFWLIFLVFTLGLFSSVLTKMVISLYRLVMKDSRHRHDEVDDEASSSGVPDDELEVIKKKFVKRGNNFKLRDPYLKKNYKYGIPKSDDSSMPKIPSISRRTRKQINKDEQIKLTIGKMPEAPKKLSRRAKHVLNDEKIMLKPEINIRKLKHK